MRPAFAKSTRRSLEGARADRTHKARFGCWLAVTRLPQTLTELTYSPFSDWRGRAGWGDPRV